MKTTILLDNIMRQTTVLIAQLAVSAKIRAPIAHLADEVFVRLSDELCRQGVPQKVVADMFGIAFRGYQRKISRLRQSSTESTTTLWEAVLRYIQDQGPLTRAALVGAFRRDDPDSIRSVLRDLSNVGLIQQEGRTGSARLRATPAEEVALLARSADDETLRSLVWLDIGRHPGCQPEEVAARLSLAPEDLEKCTTHLQESGEVTRTDSGALIAQTLLISSDTSTGWETAIFDQFRAMCSSMVTKLQLPPQSKNHDEIGGATYSFDIYPGHPKEQQVRGLLRNMKAQVGSLWTDVEDYNAKHRVDSDTIEPVTFYFGQGFTPNEKEQASPAPSNQEKVSP